MAENFNIQIQDSISPGIIRKLTAIAEKSVAAYTAIEKLTKSLAQIAAGNFSGVETSIGKATAALEKYQAAAAHLVTPAPVVATAPPAATQAIPKLQATPLAPGVAGSVEALSRSVAGLSVGIAIAQAAEQKLQAQQAASIVTTDALTKARERERAEANQARVTQALGITDKRSPTLNSARASGQVFVEAERAQKKIQSDFDRGFRKLEVEHDKIVARVNKARADEIAVANQAKFNKLLGVTPVNTGSAKASAQAFIDDAKAKAEFKKGFDKLQAENDAIVKPINKSREQQVAANNQQRFNQLLGVNPVASGSARASAQAFIEDAKAKATAAKSTEDLQQRTTKLISAVDPLAAAQVRLNKVTAEAANLLGKQAIGTDQYDRIVRKAQQQFDNKTNQIQRTESKQQTGPADDATAKANAEAKKATKEYANFQRQTDSFLNSVDPLRAAQQRLSGATSELNKHLAAGTIGTEQHARGLAFLQKEYKNSETAARKYGAATGYSRNQLLTFQYTANDVVASLASGLPVSTIFFQQIGQVTQAFGGIRGTLDATIGKLSILQGGLIAAGIAAAAYIAIYTLGESELNKFNNILNVTGNAAGFTAGSYDEAVRRVASATNTSVRSNQELANSLLHIGGIQKKQIEEFTFSATRLSQLTGKSADDIIKEFGKAAEGPDKYAEHLQRSLGAISPAQLSHIRELVEIGDKSKALEVLSKSLYDYLSGKVPEQLGFLQRAWNGVFRSISDALTALKEFGKEKTPQTAASETQAKIDFLENKKSRSVGGYDPNIDKLLSSLRTKLGYETESLNLNETAAIAQAQSAEAIVKSSAASAKLKSEFETFYKGPERAADKIKEMHEQIDAILKKDPKNELANNILKNIDKVEANIRKKFDPPGPKGPQTPKHEVTRESIIAHELGLINKQAAGYGQLAERKQALLEIDKLDLQLADKRATATSAAEKAKFKALDAREKLEVETRALQAIRDNKVSQVQETQFQDSRGPALQLAREKKAAELNRQINPENKKPFLNDEEIAKSLRKAQFAYKEATDDIAAFRREVEDANKALSVGIDERVIEGRVTQRKRELEPQGKPLKPEDEAFIRSSTKALQDKERATRALDAIEQETTIRRKEFIAAEQAITEARSRGIIGIESYTRRMLELKLAVLDFNLSNGIGTFEDAVTASLGRLTAGFQGLQKGISDSFGTMFVGLQDGFARTIGDALIKGKSLKDGLQEVAQTILSDLIGSLVKLGTQYIASIFLADVLNITQSNGAASVATKTTAEIAGIALVTEAKILAGQALIAAAAESAIALGAIGAAIATAFAPAAAAVSLASFGSNAIEAGVGIAATYALTEALAIPKGFQSGGYTGDGGVSQIAGVVHGQEYVVNASATARNRDTLEAMNRGEAPNGGGVKVVVNNMGTPQTYEVQSITPNEVRMIARDEAKEAVHRHAPNVVAADMNNPNSPTSKSINRNTNTIRKR